MTNILGLVKWATICQIKDLSFIESRMPLQIYLFFRRVQSEVGASIRKWVVFFVTMSLIFCYPVVDTPSSLHRYFVSIIFPLDPVTLSAVNNTLNILLKMTKGSIFHKKMGILLCFDLLTRSKMPFKVMYRKEVTHSNGSYERKLRGLKLADEMGRGKKKSHYTLIDWRTGREWPLNCMTVISARWRSHRPFQR